jgi:hypothetical protein
MNGWTRKIVSVAQRTSSDLNDAASIAQLSVGPCVTLASRSLCGFEPVFEREQTGCAASLRTTA